MNGNFEFGRQTEDRFSILQALCSFLHRRSSQRSAMLMRRKSPCPSLQGSKVFGVLCACAGYVFFLVGSSKAAVNVYLATGAPASLQTEFIKDATSQYNGTLVASPYQPGSYSFTISSKKPVAPSTGTITMPCELDKDIALMVQASTWSYVYGFVDGQELERDQDLDIIGNLAVHCSTTTTCEQALGYAEGEIYDQNFSSPTVIVPGL